MSKQRWIIGGGDKELPYYVFDEEAEPGDKLAFCATNKARAVMLARALNAAPDLLEACEAVKWSQTTINKLRLDLDNALRKLREIMAMTPCIVGGGDGDDEWKKGWDEGYSEAADFAAMTARDGLPE